MQETKYRPSDATLGTELRTLVFTALAFGPVLVLSLVNFLLPRLPSDPPLRVRGNAKYACAVVGTARYRSALQKIYRNATHDRGSIEVHATLVPRDKDNVLVCIGGAYVGLLPKDLAQEYHTLLSESGYPKLQSLCKARITLRLHQGIGGHADFMVRLDMPARSGALEIEECAKTVAVGV